MAAASIAMQRSNQRSSLDLRGSCSESHGGRSEADGFSFRSSKARSVRFTPSDRDTIGAQNERHLIQCPSSIASPCSNGTARNDSAFHAAADELTPNINELSGIGDSIASAPSSYRKLRKAKSMFSTRKRAMKSSDSSYSPFRSSTCSDNPEMGHLSRATLRRSKSFFAAEIAQKPDGEKRTDSQNAAIQLAREQYLQELQQSKRNDGSASILSGRGRHQSRPFRKSLRSSSGWDAENEIPVAPPQPIKPSVIYPSKTLRNSTSRIFSLSIKNGLRRIFGRSMAQEERCAPTVQRKHALGFSDYISSESGGPASIGNRPASIRTMKSSDSFATLSSRATSWTDSTATNITATRDAVSERNRLSIIQENGVPPDSTPSRLSFHYNDGYSVFRKPLHPGRSGNNAFDAVDSQRVYSALRGVYANYQADTSSAGPISKFTKPDIVESLQRSKSSLCQPSRQKRSEIPNPLVPPRFSSYEHAINSDDDIESVIVSRPGDIARSCVSPSVYSRTTSGDTPRHFGSRRDLSFSESSDERGTVTILASERLPYKPNDAGGYTCSDSKIRGSAEWKSWMSSQMDLLDATPENYAKIQYVKSPNTHYREMTEIHGELKDGNPEASYTMPQTNEYITAEPPEGPPSLDVDQRQPLVELKSFTQNNFSRPLRLSPDIPISISRPAVQKPFVVARSESAHSLHIAPDVDPERSTPTDAVLPRNASRSPSASLLAYEKPECLDLATLPVTPTRLPKAIQSTISLRNHSGKDSPTRRLSDPRKLSPTVNFSSVRNRRDNARVTNENLRGGRVPTKSNLPELGDIHSTISSKRMVDIFLSQRRRQMGGAEKGTEHAFI
ncbi:predicted protein [Histoplasma mississippiense (nom. inval.)]|uniref:predicted protein n=1 Tax=Ajellomyces capsulatus (strain NAm1 / WU24) TaxID=2059318 RepID=UPI000157BC6A|nr:predicted protein [Histoplasma mississippiense (nom. inval.)]EDN06331.1 predicted protein [Histoplasma mississippiense (nom. inval.)]